MSSGVLYCGGALEILRKFPTFNSSMPVAQPLPSGKGCWFNGLLYEESTEAEMEVIFTDRLSGRGHKTRKIYSLKTAFTKNRIRFFFTIYFRI
jgi:hypothetical protein